MVDSRRGAQAPLIFVSEHHLALPARGSGLVFAAHSTRFLSGKRGFPMRVAREAWSLGKDSILGFINDNALSHGAAMAFYAVTSLTPFC